MMSGTDVLKKIMQLEVIKQADPPSFGVVQMLALNVFYEVLGRQLDFCEIQNVATRVGELQKKEELLMDLEEANAKPSK